MTAKLDFIVGRSGTGKTRQCLDSICAAIEEAPLGDPLVLLVPEAVSEASREVVVRSKVSTSQAFLGVGLVASVRSSRIYSVVAMGLMGLIGLMGLMELGLKIPRPASALICTRPSWVVTSL